MTQARLDQVGTVFTCVQRHTKFYSPAELLFHRTFQTRLSLLKPSVYNTVTQSQAVQKEQHDKKGRERQFEVNQQVLIENPKKESEMDKWNGC